MAVSSTFYAVVIECPACVCFTIRWLDAAISYLPHYVLSILGAVLLSTWVRITLFIHCTVLHLLQICFQDSLQSLLKTLSHNVTRYLILITSQSVGIPLISSRQFLAHHECDVFSAASSEMLCPKPISSVISGVNIISGRQLHYVSNWFTTGRPLTELR